jgi:hypothetical protein
MFARANPKALQRRLKKDKMGISSEHQLHNARKIHSIIGEKIGSFK